MRKLKFYICKVLFYLCKILGMSLNQTTFSLIDEQIRTLISKNKYNLSITVLSITPDYNTNEIEIKLEYPTQEITTISLLFSSGPITIIDSKVNSNTKNKSDFGKIYYIIDNVVDELNFTPSEKFRDLKRKSFIGKTKGR